jgi:cell division protein FtsZ
MNTIIASASEKISSRIKVMGLGGAGCNTISRLAYLQIPGVGLIAANTDRQSLQTNPAGRKILLGSKLTRGLGAGGNPTIGKLAAEESFREIIQTIKDTDLLFLTAGMGGGTGSGAIQIAARIAKSMDIPTISIVTIPFGFEAGRRQTSAHEAIAALQPFTDTLITIPNNKLLEIASPETTLEAAFGLSDDVLLKGIQGISEMLSAPGLMDVDFSHIVRLMKNKGGTYISIGYGDDPQRAIHAIEQALSHPLLEDIHIDQAQGIIVKFSGNLSISELDHAMQYLQEHASPDVEIIPAVNSQERLNGQIMVTMLVTGIGATAVEYPTVEIARMQEKEAEIEIPQEEPSLVLDIPERSLDLAEKDMDDLEVPAFIRRGYNQLTQTVSRNG